MNQLRALWAAVALLAVYSVILTVALVLTMHAATQPSDLELCLANSTTERELELCIVRAN